MLWLLLACGPTFRADGGEPPLALANCVGTMDFDAGVDDSIEGQWVFHYNELGDPLEATYDINADGSVNSRMTFAYAQDLLTERDWDGGADGVIDTRTFYFYDEDHRLLEERAESGGELSDRVTYDYNSDRQVAIQWHWKGEGGTLLYEKGTFTWDGDLKRTVTWESANSVALVTLDYENDLLAREDIHEGHSARVNQRELTTWDAMGRKARVDKDIGADSVVEYRSDWSYECE